MSAGESAESEKSTRGDDSDLADAANVLVLSERLDSDARTSYVEELVATDLSNLLVVSFADDPARWLENWHSASDPPGTAVFVEGVERDDANDPPGVERVLEEPADLTGLGITVSERLTDWGSDSLLIFESLTLMLEHVELKRAFRFLHVLVNRVKATGSTAHYHIDPAEHDDRTIATLTSLFDTVVTYEDGSWQESSWP